MSPPPDPPSPRRNPAHHDLAPHQENAQRNPANRSRSPPSQRDHHNLATKPAWNAPRYPANSNRPILSPPYLSGSCIIYLELGRPQLVTQPHTFLHGPAVTNTSAPSLHQLILDLLLLLKTKTMCISSIKRVSDTSESRQEISLSI